MSLNMTGVSYTGEGPDFRLEVVNGIQSFLSIAPKNEDWEKVCASCSTLNHIRSKLLEDKGHVNNNVCSVKPAKLSPDEELAVRAMFREKKYMSDPTIPKEHVSFFGSPLSKQLVRFCDESAEKHAAYVTLDHVLLHRQTFARDKTSAVKTNITPIFVTEEEEQEYLKLRRRTTAELEIIIENTLLNYWMITSEENRRKII